MCLLLGVAQMGSSWPVVIIERVDVLDFVWLGCLDLA